MTDSRRYVSPKRQAQAAATREAILATFAEQLSDPTRTTLSPSEAAARADVSVRTVHVHFPNRDSQIVAVGESFDRRFYWVGRADGRRTGRPGSLLPRDPRSRRRGAADPGPDVGAEPGVA